MLYDFTAEVGDTITIDFWANFSIMGTEQFYIRLDSIDMIEYNTLSLKRFHVSMSDLYS